jgi:hypothetical protein
MTMAASASLAAASSPVLVFWDKRAASYNGTYVEASSDGGTTWSQVAAWSSSSNDHSTWLMEQFSLAKFVGKSVKIRFRLAQTGTYTGDGWYVDDVEIRESTPVDTAGVGAAGCGAMPAAVGIRYFCDDFESGLAKWIVSSQDWNTIGVTARSGLHSVTESPDGNLLTGENAAITMAVATDLTGAVSPVLVFWDKRAASYNGTYVEASSDGGTTWSQVAAWSSSSNDHSTWLQEQSSLATFVGKSVMIRFRLAQSGSYSGDGWYVDDVEIRETTPADTTRAQATGCAAMPAAVATRYFCDDFESGLSRWMVSSHDWNTTSTTARSGQYSVTDSPDGNILSGENAAITMAVPTDLTGTTAPVVVFWDKTAAGSNYTYVEASPDGGTTWSQLKNWYNADHSTWMQEQFSLTSYVGKSVMIRFRLAQSGSNTGDGWYVDDVEIREAN